MSVGAWADLDCVSQHDSASKRRLSPSSTPDFQARLMLGLQQSAGNAAVAQRLSRQRLSPGARPHGPSAVGTDAARPVLQRWPFSSDSDEESTDQSSGGVVSWLGEQGAAAVGAASDAVSGVSDWAKAQGGAVVDAATEAVGGAVSEVQAAATASAHALIDQKRAALTAQISAARQQLGGQGTISVSAEDLAKLNGKLAMLRSQSRGLVSVPDVAGSTAEEADGDKLIDATAFGSLLTSLQSAISLPVSSSDNQAAQRDVQRLVGEEVITPEAEDVAVKLLAGGLAAAPETGGVSLAVVLIILVIVALIIAILVYATSKSDKKTEGPGPVTTEDPTGKPDPKKKSKNTKKEEERKRCLPDRECRETEQDPCPVALPISWPQELPLPLGPVRLVRVKDEDVAFPKERRGGAQARLRDEIAANRQRLLPPPRPCDPDGELDPNEPRDAHHRHPLALGGRDADENLCALEAVAHQRGHPRLNSQVEHFDEYQRECCYCTPNINDHPAGQDYFIAGSK